MFLRDLLEYEPHSGIVSGVEPFELSRVISLA